ncbi:pseudouridylate synthase TRUB2, mitochondrial [Spea bombifrons]|uniref:pseudouridylate synthase TRUB2, mitochondrial n=1 Tax=Spea bombifrons TaxID=233779 RepID=UPI00234AA815|nr:pseudouridylate synthase TRUB2, mitochondrial [Spea bombifrons]
MSRSASSVFQSLQGFFAVYKPPGVHWKLVRDNVETNLLKELNSLETPPPRQLIRFQPVAAEGTDGVELTRVATAVPALADVLVKGAPYTSLKIGAGHRLDARSSGVFVLGIGRGNRLLTDMYNSHCTRDYTVCGSFGTATDDFSDTGRIIEKTTYGHVTRDKLERILAVIQGSNRKALLTHSHIDLKSQEAYELAVAGQLRPMVKSPPIILGMRCLDFSPPDFTLEIQCMHETQQYLRKVIHEIGLELRSSAVCTKVRRTRDGSFTVDCALLHTHWDLYSIRQAVKESRGRAADLIRRKIENLDRLQPAERDTESPSNEDGEELRM